MRAPWWIVLATGCWSAAPAPPAAAPPAAPAGTCTIRDGAVQPMSAIALRVEGATFATLTEEVERFELFASTATMRVETTQVELAGELDLATFGVRPRQPMRDGWVEVLSSTVDRAKGASASLAVALPEGLKPAIAYIDVPCAELTSVEGTGEPAEDGESVVIERPTPLLDAPGGKERARIDPGQGESVPATILERRGGLVRVLIDGTNPVRGWIAGAAVGTTPGYGLGGGGVGYGGLGSRPRSITCPAPTPIYVRTKTRGIVRVGHLRPRQTVNVKGEPEVNGPVEIDLGKAEVQPFLRPGDVADCQR
ncbi:MAG: hypothetical protein KIT31_32670 [Deltaproteobacteria bacterium]|nr:hypothetical protein [Deltaproteobacteria bacterium]